MSNATRRKRTRYHSKWRVDEDYASKLSADERAWLDRFNDEYYRGEFSADALHERGAPRRALYNAHNAAARDVVTAAAPAVADALRPAAPRPSLAPRFYTPADYRRTVAGSPESALVGWIDSQYEPPVEDKQLDDKISETETYKRRA